MSEQLYTIAKRGDWMHIVPVRGVKCSEVHTARTVSINIDLEYMRQSHETTHSNPAARTVNIGSSTIPR